MDLEKELSQEEEWTDKTVVAEDEYQIGLNEDKHLFLEECQNLKVFQMLNLKNTLLSLTSQM